MGDNYLIITDKLLRINKQEIYLPFSAVFGMLFFPEGTNSGAFTQFSAESSPIPLSELSPCFLRTDVFRLPREIKKYNTEGQINESGFSQNY